MKALKNIFYVLLGTMTVVSVASCSDSPDYDEAATPTNEQVFFPNTNPQALRLSGSEKSFDVTVKRANTKGALSVALDVEGDSLLSVPSSVSFADGQDEAKLTVGYDLATLGYDNPQDLTIALKDANQGTPYGISSYKVNVIIPSPWTSLGQATVTDDLISGFYGVDNVSFKVEIQENDLVPGYYRLVNAYTSCYPYNEDGDYDATQDYYLYIHAEDPDFVYFEQQALGMDWGYGMFRVWSRADWYISDRGEDPQAVKDAGWFGTLKNGEITFPTGGVIISMDGYKDGEVRAANGSGLFSILLPGYVKADYSVAVSYAGLFTDKDEALYAVADLELGPDAKDVKAVVMPQDADAAAVADAIAAGELEATDVQAGRIQVPFNAEELGGPKYQVIVVVIADGEAKNVATSNFEYYGAGGGNPWQSLGTGYYTDDAVITLFFNVAPPTYEVEILENTTTPGIYRLVDPYSDAVYPYTADQLKKTLAPAGMYLEVNAEDPEAVYIERQDLGMDWGYGPMSLETAGPYYVNRGNSFEDVKAAGRFGTLKDGVIEFPALTYTYQDEETGEELTAQWQGNLYLGSNAYDAGANGAMKIWLPGVEPSVKAKAAAMARATSFENRLMGKTLRSSKGNDIAKKKAMIKTLRSDLSSAMPLN